jgi:hypothetical protein
MGKLHLLENTLLYGCGFLLVSPYLHTFRFLAIEYHVVPKQWFLRCRIDPWISCRIANYNE